MGLLHDTTAIGWSGSKPHHKVTKAIAREKQLKGWKRVRKIELIESANPAWIDLSRDWYDCEPADHRRAFDRMNS
jgi:putative endonuclease